MSDDVFGSCIHEIFVVLVLGVSCLWNVFDSMLQLFDLNRKVGVFRDPAWNCR